MELGVLFLTCYTFLKTTLILTQALALGTLAVVSYRFLKQKRRSGFSASVIPGLKERVYNPLGIHGFVPSRSTMRKASLQINAYILQVYAGLAVLFPKEKVVKTTVGYNTFVVLTKPEAVEEYFNTKAPDTKAFLGMWKTVFRNGLFVREGHSWKAMRKLLNPVFSNSVMKNFIPTIDKQSKILSDILKANHLMDWTEIATPISSCCLDITGETILGCSLGAQTKGNSDFIEALHRLPHSFTHRTMTPIYYTEAVYRISAAGRQYYRDLNCMKTFLEKIIRERKNCVPPQETENKERGCQREGQKFDMLDHLLDLHKQNPDFTLQNVEDEIFTFFPVGHGTTAPATTWSLYLIGLYPEVQRKIHEELDTVFGDDTERPVTADDLRELRYLDCVLKECQRIYPALPFIPKEALQDFQLCGYTIKKGTVIVISPYVLHRDPEAFPDPEKFDPDRFRPENCVHRNPYAYIPFYAGSRNCIGRYFAMLEEKVIIANLLRNFSVRSKDPRDKVIEISEIALRSQHPLKAKFSLRHAARENNVKPI